MRVGVALPAMADQLAEHCADERTPDDADERTPVSLQFFTGHFFLQNMFWGPRLRGWYLLRKTGGALGPRPAPRSHVEP